MHIKRGLAYLFLLVRLQAVAGELIKIDNIAVMRPTVTVKLAKVQASELAKVPEKAAAILGLYMIVNDTPAHVAVAGKYHLKGRRLSFSPAHNLGGNMEFEARYVGKHRQVTKRFTTPAGIKSQETAKVLTAYPMGDTIPYNALFFHLRFSQAMMQDERAYKNIKIFDDNGIERTGAWRQKSYWLDDGRLLVLMIHPGRVKNGIHYESPLFDSGRYYTIWVDRNIKDINGNPMDVDYAHQYFVKGEDRQSPQVNIMAAVLPVANTLQPLQVSFSEAMDYASVFDGMSVQDSNGNLVSGTTLVNKVNDNYTLVPSKAWKNGRYVLRLKSNVCDIAGNRMQRLFETTDIRDMEKDRQNTELSFEIR